MSKLSTNAIKEYQAIYKQEFGEEISLDEASEQAIRLLRIFSLVYKPINKKNINKKLK